jgi:hypothetical protein
METKIIMEMSKHKNLRTEERTYFTTVTGRLETSLGSCTYSSWDQVTLKQRELYGSPR